MNPEIADLLSELALGTLSAERRADIEAQVAASPALRRELDRLTETLAVIPAFLPPAEPSRGARARLWGTLAGPDRFAPFFDQLSRIFDLGAEALRRVLADVDVPAAWRAGYPGVKYIDFAAGPRLEGASAGLVRLPAGGVFPRHRHLGSEVTLVLEGTLVEDGVAYGPGQIRAYATGTVHTHVAGPDRPMVAATLHHGIVVDGSPQSKR